LATEGAAFSEFQSRRQGVVVPDVSWTKAPQRSAGAGDVECRPGVVNEDGP